MTQFVENPIWSGIAEGFKNPTYIADRMLPYKSVTAELFKTDYYDIAQTLVAPDNRVGRLNRPPLLDFQSKQREFSTEDYAYDAPLPNFDRDRAKQQRDGKQTSFNPEIFLVQGVKEIFMLRREKRVAKMLASLSNYLPSQQQVLAGPSQWTNPASRPKDLLMAVMDSMLQRPNKMQISRLVWTALRSNPQMVEAVLGTSAKEGVASLQAVAELLELDEIIVGDSFSSMSESQDPDRQVESINRLWANDCILFYDNPNAQAISGFNQFTFGFTARWGGVKTGTVEDPFMGARGGKLIRIYECAKELITAKFCGYIIKDCIPAALPFTMDRVM